MKSKEYFGELALLSAEEEEVIKTTRRSVSYVNLKQRATKEDEDKNKDAKTRQTSVYATTNAELLTLSAYDFNRFITATALKRLRDYAKGYPKESEIRSLFWKQKQWKMYKQHLVQSIAESCGRDQKN